jgi:hypothetical protein
MALRAQQANGDRSPERRGPGRPRKPGDFPRHVARPAVRARVPLLVRVRVQPDVWRLDTRRTLPVVVAALSEGADRFGVRIVFYRVESDRLLLVVEAENRLALKRGMQGFGIRLSKAINRLMGTRGSILAERYHLTALAEPEQTRAALIDVLVEKAGSASLPRVGRLAEPRSRALRSALSSTRLRRVAARVPSARGSPQSRGSTASG